VTTVTSTRTHVLVGFANPFLKCDKCKVKVPYWHNPERCGCDASYYNHPCTHTDGVTSSCPSWTPVDGCICDTPCSK
jgi:hypothetical protein